MDQAFADRVALVTGASSGIGAAIARGLSARGARVILVARGAPALSALAGELGERATVQTADIGDETSVRNLARRVISTFGGVDLLIHNAGAYVAAPLATAALADLDYQWNVNLRGPYLLTQLLLPGLTERRGQVLFMNSSAGARSHANVSQYAASKFALKAVADALREEVNPAGVRVITVFPGRTATPMQQEIIAREGRPWMPDKLLQPEDVAAVTIHSLALPRTAEVTDVHVRPMGHHP